MSKIDVITFTRTSDTEIHIYPPDDNPTWWARRVSKYVGGGELWQLNSDDDGDAEGYFDDVEPMMQYVSEHFEDAPVVESKARDDW
jgi:hypothetical protein